MSTLLTKLCVGEEVDFDPCQQLLDNSDCVNPQTKIRIFMTLCGLIVFIELCWSIIRGSLGREPYNEAFHATLALPMRGDIQRKDRPPDLVKHKRWKRDAVTLMKTILLFCYSLFIVLVTMKIIVVKLFHLVLKKMMMMPAKSNVTPHLTCQDNLQTDLPHLSQSFCRAEYYTEPTHFCKIVFSRNLISYIRFWVR